MDNMSEPGWEVLTIEDTSDCETCTRRDAEDLRFMAEVRIKVIGSAWCQECGREFEVITAD